MAEFVNTIPMNPTLVSATIIVLLLFQQTAAFSGKSTICLSGKTETEKGWNLYQHLSASYDIQTLAVHLANLMACSVSPSFTNAMIHILHSLAQRMVGVELEISLKTERLCMEFIIWQVTLSEIAQKRSIKPRHF